MLKSLAFINHYRQGDTQVAAEHPWLQIIVSAEERIVNFERIQSIQELALANPVLDYVERTLMILDRLALSFWKKELLEEVLMWSEAAKGGTSRERMIWQEQGINLFVHNRGSSQLYWKSQSSPGDKEEVIHTLIETHGLIGQTIRGEVPLHEHSPLTELVTSGKLTEDELRGLLVPLNQCIIGAVSQTLWHSVEAEVGNIVEQIVSGSFAVEFPLKERLARLRDLAIKKGENFDAEFEKLAPQFSIEALAAFLERKTLWFVESALQDFSFEQLLKVFLLVMQQEQHTAAIRHISFEPLMSLMYYDYKGVKKVNVYKKRMIEKYLSELTWTDIQEGCEHSGNAHLTHLIAIKPKLPDTIFFTFDFSAAAEKLIAFCVEAEKSPLYEKAVLLLFDLFELRRDAYDRFHNEEAYLATMNQTADYKKRMLDYVVGERVVDIGPGGGVMLDLIEQHLPDKHPIGIDISLNVIEALQRKKQLEGHKWEVRKGDALNLREYVEPGSIGTVIFSSILHELYSYIPFNGKKFNHETVAAALRSAFDVLSPGGRIVIRDGIMTEPRDQTRRIRFLKPDTMGWLERYAKDFAGRAIKYEVLSVDEVRMPVNDAMEFLYTYTWGEEAYVHEIQEQFGYFTPSEYIAFIHETLGPEAKIIENRHFLQEGYTEALGDRVRIMNEEGLMVPLPDSTCLIVIEK
ncbi:class I SAM-dependent methyltransferase [Paenibacillus sp. SYP-B3998]|uniref:Class I SAM-dependent methyltransferase n=1 Tax=Paenibacillus sp. SYP-B3998 TaxID=2678564 RepID=A0A6G4A1Q0_9BACL|nr:class I SAM-dependent methyltransferase [Paenibacillus sp. SYP-B3998]NEW08305.1 class I SAM-dependent methyltransferase [Paenibacillus sp. SYP-B3998]